LIFKDLFSHVKSVSVEETKKIMKDRPFDSYTLVDVREPEEYEAGHIPGAVFIPLSQLADRISEIDPDKRVISY